MTMHQWLDAAAAKLAETLGDDRALYELSAADQRALLELARLAAHESGARTNAPLVTFLAGVARGRHPERSLPDLLDELG
jgi:hypothetical protein